MTRYTRGDLRPTLVLLRAAHELAGLPPPSPPPALRKSVPADDPNVRLLLAAAAELSTTPGEPAEELAADLGKWGVVRHQYSQPRFLGVLKVCPIVVLKALAIACDPAFLCASQVPPFSPHDGGSLYSPFDVDEHHGLMR